MIPQTALENNISLFYRMTAPLELHLERMCHHGVPVSKEVLLFKAKAWKERMAEEVQQVYDYVGTTFNLDSPKQVQEVLYGKTGKFKFEPVKIWDKQKREFRTSTGQYAFGSLYYQHKLPILRNWGTYRRLRHRYSNFVVKFLKYEACQQCTDKTKSGCTACAGTRIGEITGYDPRYVKEHNGEWRIHPNLMLLAVTGRPISLDPNILQFPRNNKTWDIDCRDIVVARDGYKIVLYDLAKAERYVGGLLYDDPVMLEEVALGSRAFSKMASEVLNIPEDQCGKGTDWYTVMKTAAYAHQYFVQAQTLHEFLMKQDIFIPLEMCEHILQALDKRYENYRHNVFYWVEKWLRDRDPVYVTNPQGRLFRLYKPIELEGYTDYQKLIYGRSTKAKTAFYEMCRKITSLSIQSTATGDNCQGDSTYLIDHLDKLVNPNWSPDRFNNGNWNIIAPLWLKYDETAFEVREDWVPVVEDKLKTLPGNFKYIEDYLGRKIMPGLKLGVECETYKVWDVHVPDDASKRTKETNPRHYYENGVRFKA